MSIYRDTRRTQQNVTFELADVESTLATKALPDAGIAPMRRATPADTLLRATSLWLQNLPMGLRPLALCEQFPRIANQFASTWRDPIAANDYFAALLLDNRGGRHGFPENILDELLALQAYYETEHPTADDRWQES